MKLQISIGMIAIAIAPIFSNAVPTKFNSCDVKIKHVPEGSGAYLSADCTKLYVLPPPFGKMTFHGYRENANMDEQCGRLKSIDEDQANLDENNKISSKRLVRFNKRILEIEENLDRGLMPPGKTKEDLEDEVDELTEKMSEIRAKARKWQLEQDENRLSLAIREGGRGGFAIENSYPELLDAYQKANPELSVEKMPLDQSFLSINEESASEEGRASHKAVTRIQAEGVEAMPMLVDASLLLTHKELANFKAPSDSTFFGDALGGSIDLSVIGSCAVRNLGLGQTFRASDLRGYVNASVTYSYQVQVERNYKLTLNLKELIKQIHHVSRKGGLFSRKTLNSFVDNRTQTEWITFEFESDDARNQFSDADIKEIKGQFLDRALAQIVELKTGSPAAVLTLIETNQKNGADVVGDELGKCPHLYCQIGSAGFKFLSAVFGSESQVSEMIKSFEGEHVEISKERRMVPQYSTYTFE